MRLGRETSRQRPRSPPQGRAPGVEQPRGRMLLGAESREIVLPRAERGGGHADTVRREWGGPGPPAVTRSAASSPAPAGTPSSRLSNESVHRVGPRAPHAGAHAPCDESRGP